MDLLEEVQTLLPDTELMQVAPKADLLKPLPPMWDEAQHETAWRDGGSEGEPMLPLLLDGEGQGLCLSAASNVGLDAMRLEIVGA